MSRPAGRPARPWFRFYTEAFRDFKILRLSPQERWVWVAVLGAARESCDPGRLLVSPGEPMTVDELARYADVPRDQVWTALEKMKRHGMVGFGEEDGLIVVLNWDLRQYESDSSTERARKHRSMQQDCNVAATFDATSPETETEAETETEGGGARSETSSKPRGKTAIPSPYVISEANLAWVKATYPTLDLHLETQKLVAWAKANDRRYANWDQAWRNWMHKAAERERGGRSW